MQAKKNQMTVLELSIELQVGCDKIIAGLNLPESANGNTFISASDANKIRRAMEAFKSENNPVQLRLVSSEDNQTTEPPAELATEDIKAIAKAAKVPQSMVKALYPAILEKEVAIAYSKGRNEAQIKHTLQLVEQKGAEDFVEQMQIKGLIDQFKKADSHLQEVQEISDFVDNLDVTQTLQRMGLVPVNPLKVVQKEYDQIVENEQIMAAAIAKLHNGEELTEQEKKIPSITRLIRTLVN